MENPIFKETSRLFSPFMLLTLAPTAIFFLTLLLYNIKKGSLLDIIICTFVLILEIILIFILLLHKLDLTISNNEIIIKYPPYYFKPKIFLRNKIKKINLVEYNPMNEFWGWGYKKSKKFGQGITTQGNLGLHIILEDNKSYLISVFDRKKIEEVLNL